VKRSTRTVAIVWCDGFGIRLHWKGFEPALSIKRIGNAKLWYVSDISKRWGLTIRKKRCVLTILKSLFLCAEGAESEHTPHNFLESNHERPAHFNHEKDKRLRIHWVMKKMCSGHYNPLYIMLRRRRNRRKPPRKSKRRKTSQTVKFHAPIVKVTSLWYQRTTLSQWVHELSLSA